MNDAQKNLLDRMKNGLKIKLVAETWIALGATPDVVQSVIDAGWVTEPIFDEVTGLMCREINSAGLAALAQE